MKLFRCHTLLLLLTGSFSLSHAVAVTLPFYDGLAYTNGTPLGDDGSGSEAVWSIGNSPSVDSPAITNTAALSYPGLPDSGGLGVRVRNPGGSNKESGVDTASHPMTGLGQTLYASFLLNLQSYPAANCPVAYFDDNGSPSDSFQGVGLLPDGRLTLHRNAGVNSPGGTNATPLSLGTTYLIVFRYKSVTNSSNDELALWVNPALGLAGEPTPNLTMATGGADRTALRGFLIKQNTAFSAVMYFDELRLGTNWADVTPSGGPVAPAPVPVITQVLMSPEGMILRGTNGPASGTYQVLASTNLTLPLSNWANIAAHPFDVAGNFDSTNPVAAVASQQFFRLLVGGTLPPAPTGPTIQTQPQSQTVTEGDDATFSVTATGTAPLSYQWYFNTNTTLANATNTTLIVTNPQATNAGKYSVVVTNVVGSVTSAFATLTVTAPSAPTITNQPAPQSVSVGQTAVFSVIATGTSPLFYQWYFNTNTALTGGTNATLTLPNAQTHDAGGYSVIVTNSLGAVTSVVATLTVNTNQTITPSTNMIGYATLNGGTTGGAGGATVTVSNFTDFNTYVGNNTTPYIIQVVGTINLGGSNVRVRNNKTIIGLGTNATLVGDLKVDGNTNVIIRNLNFTNPDGAGDNDGLTLQDCLNVWVDHCTFYDGADGNLDISHGADWITVSWCRFFYTDAGASHRFSNLVGHSDNNAGEDAGKLHVTFHHNWWGQYVHERMPRVRFGRIHSFNNYFNSPGNNYCFRVARDAEVLIENNYFLDVKNPWEVYVTTGTTGKVHAVNNIQVGTTFAAGDDNNTLLVPGTDTVFEPAYSYTPDTAGTVPNTITNHAGAGKGPFAP